MRERLEKHLAEKGIRNVKAIKKNERRIVSIPRKIIVEKREDSAPSSPLLWKHTLRKKQSTTQELVGLYFEAVKKRAKLILTKKKLE